MEHRLIGIAAASNQILDKHVARSNRRLSKQTQATRKSLLIHVRNASSIQLDHTASQAEYPGQRTQERRLSAGVRANDDGQFAWQNIQRKPFEDRVIFPIADDDVPSTQPTAHSGLTHDLTSRINNQRR